MKKLVFILSLLSLTAGAQLVNPITNGQLRSDLDANGNKITGLSDGADPGDAVNKGQLDTAVGSLGGDMVKAVYDVGDDGVVDQVNWSDAVDAALLPDSDGGQDLGSGALRWGNAYINSLDVTTVTGFSLSGPLNANSQQINNLADGTLSGDAVNKDQLDTAVNGIMVTSIYDVNTDNVVDEVNWSDPVDSPIAFGVSADLYAGAGSNPVNPADWTLDDMTVVSDKLRATYGGDEFSSMELVSDWAAPAATEKSLLTLRLVVDDVSFDDITLDVLIFELPSLLGDPTPITCSVGDTIEIPVTMAPGPWSSQNISVSFEFTSGAAADYVSFESVELLLTPPTITRLDDGSISASGFWDFGGTGEPSSLVLGDETFALYDVDSSAAEARVLTTGVFGPSDFKLSVYSSGLSDVYKTVFQASPQVKRFVVGSEMALAGVGAPRDPSDAVTLSVLRDALPEGASDLGTWIWQGGTLPAESVFAGLAGDANDFASITSLEVSSDYILDYGATNPGYVLEDIQPIALLRAGDKITLASDVDTDEVTFVLTGDPVFDGSGRSEHTMDVSVESSTGVGFAPAENVNVSVEYVLRTASAVTYDPAGDPITSETDLQEAVEDHGIEIDLKAAKAPIAQLTTQHLISRWDLVGSGVIGTAVEGGHSPYAFDLSPVSTPEYVAGGGVLFDDSETEGLQALELTGPVWSLLYDGEEMSLECWVTGDPADNPLAGVFFEASPQLSVYQEGSTLSFTVGDGAMQDVPGFFNAGEHHLVITVSPTSTKVYKNGSVVYSMGSGFASGLFEERPTNTDVRLGAEFWEGTLRRPALYSRALTATQVAGNLAVGPSIPDAGGDWASLVGDPWSLDALSRVPQAPLFTKSVDLGELNTPLSDLPVPFSPIPSFLSRLDSITDETLTLPSAMEPGEGAYVMYASNSEEVPELTLPAGVTWMSYGGAPDPVGYDSLGYPGFFWFFAGQEGEVFGYDFSQGKLLDEVATKTTTAYVDSQVDTRALTYNTTVNPTTTDDVNAGYRVGDTWQNTTTDESFVSVDQSAGAAVWRSTTEVWERLVDNDIVPDGNSTRSLGSASAVFLTGFINSLYFDSDIGLSGSVDPTASSLLIEAANQGGDGNLIVDFLSTTGTPFDYSFHFDAPVNRLFVDNEVLPSGLESTKPNLVGFSSLYVDAVANKRDVDFPPSTMPALDITSYAYTDSATPANGTMYVNNTDFTQATQIRISKNLATGFLSPMDPYIQALASGDRILIGAPRSTLPVGDYLLTADPVDSGTYYTLAVADNLTGSLGTRPTAGTDVSIQVYPQRTFTLEGVAYIDPDLNAEPVIQEGRLAWNDTEKCWEFGVDGNGTTLQIGQEMYIRARNVTGSPILNGSAVYISGAQGDNAEISLAQADARPTAEGLIGVVTVDGGIPNNSFGFVTIAGKVRDFNTDAFAEGAELYLSSSVAGGFQDTPPTADSEWVVPVGVVLRAANDGIILVNIKAHASVTGDKLRHSTSAADARSILGIVEGGLATYPNSAASYTAGTNGENVVLNNANSNAITVSLPAAASSTDVFFHIKKTDGTANTVTVDPNGSETIDGATQQVITGRSNLFIVCDGTEWHIL